MQKPIRLLIERRAIREYIRGRDEESSVSSADTIQGAGRGTVCLAYLGCHTPTVSCGLSPTSRSPAKEMPATAINRSYQPFTYQ